MPSTFFKSFVLFAAATLSALPSAHAGRFGDADIDPRFRAKIMKEKAKQNAVAAEMFNFTGSSNAGLDADCGSQNIGNVDTGGKIGAGPKEVFVFAPNAINLVSSNACK